MGGFGGKEKKKTKGPDPDNLSPKGCFMSITLVVSIITQINMVDLWVIPDLQIQRIILDILQECKYKFYITFSLSCNNKDHTKHDNID